MRPLISSRQLYVGGLVVLGVGMAGAAGAVVLAAEEGSTVLLAVSGAAIIVGGRGGDNRC